MQNHSVIQSYKIPFAPFRSLNKGKKERVERLVFGAKAFTNIIYKDMHEGVSRWNGMMKEDRTLMRKSYENF